jgi:hypothetical protein
MWLKFSFEKEIIKGELNKHNDCQFIKSAVAHNKLFMDEYNITQTTKNDQVFIQK